MTLGACWSIDSSVHRHCGDAEVTNFVQRRYELVFYLQWRHSDLRHLLPPQKKLLQKVFQLILLGFSVLFNILKVYQNRRPGKVFFQDGVQDGRRNFRMAISL